MAENKMILYFFIEPMGRFYYGNVVAEDGTCLYSYISSNRRFAESDLGYDNNQRDDIFKKHCPNGFEKVWIENPETDERVKRLWELNQKLVEEEKPK